MRKSPVVTLALVVALGLVSSQDAQATNYRDLCSAVPSACDYSGPDAPILDANVCWSRSTATATLMAGATCPTGSYPYAVKYGVVVDPGSKLVTAYVPLDDACTRPGLCQPGYLAPPTTWETAIMCCNGGTCWPNEDLSCDGELLFCDNGVSNDDGTVTCFDDVNA